MCLFDALLAGHSFNDLPVTLLAKWPLSVQAGPSTSDALLLAITLYFPKEVEVLEVNQQGSRVS